MLKSLTAVLRVLLVAIANTYRVGYRLFACPGPAMSPVWIVIGTMASASLPILCL
ncbi:hypothetical protein EDB86DRAFT_2945060 [Lactarius hatsudake]|nr:hypothetical protein EDB86DRAFT_2945060 [Lactarius hatsudake]